MDLRPAPARWFEIVVPKADAHDTMEVLARRGRVQFEWRGEHAAASDLRDLGEILARYRESAARFGGYWPPAVFERRCCALPVDVSARAAMRQIERWHEEARPRLERLDVLRRERSELELWGQVLDSLSGSDLDLGILARAGPVLAGCCLVLPKEARGPDLGDGLVVRTRFGERAALLGVVPRADLASLCSRVRSLNGACPGVPAWFEGTPAEVRAELPFRITERERETRSLEQELRHLAQGRGVDRASGVLERIEWFRKTAENIRCDGDYCWITGWTSEEDGGELDRGLRELGIASSIAFVDPPQDAPLPSVTRNPPWLAPFEVFTHAVGVPGIRDADPTTWVAMLVPLMFGYMCGDVGHGAVIAAAGVLLRRQTELWPLLVVCGLAAVGFGFVFGDVFGYEQLIDPLWLRPMEHPVEMLIVPVIFGAFVLSGGILLHAVQTCWQGEGRSKGVADAAQLLVYWGILLAFLDLRFAWLCMIGAALCLTNRLWIEGSPRALLAGVGHQAESTFTLLLNTLSFARIGAFALAHAALETAILAMAGMVSTTAAAVLVVAVGNFVVILLEGLVVSIQTTRLVLFEFFARFFEGGGRRFLPSSPPPGRDSGQSR
jgi:V/A-type H+-transporting ATPase subunit I